MNENQLVEVARGLNYLHTCDIGPVIHNDLRGVCSFTLFFG